MGWFKHDIDCILDERLSALILEFGVEGYGVFFHTLEVMYRNAGAPLARLSVKTVAKDLQMSPAKVTQILDYACSEECDRLFFKTDEGYCSERVIEESAKMVELSKARAEAGRAGGSKRQANAKQLLSKCQAIAKQKERKKDNNLGSPLQEDSQLLDTEYKTDKTEIACSEPSQRLEAGTPENAVFVTIISNKGEEIPITENMVSLWEKTYPAVDVRSELLRMKSWAIANPKNRKTRSGMQRFCDNWLARTQNEARRIPQGNHETIRGTNIRMSLVADGTRPEYPEPEVKFE